MNNFLCPNCANTSNSNTYPTPFEWLHVQDMSVGIGLGYRRLKPGMINWSLMSFLVRNIFCAFQATILSEVPFYDKLCV